MLARVDDTRPGPSKTTSEQGDRRGGRRTPVPASIGVGGVAPLPQTALVVVIVGVVVVS